MTTTARFLFVSFLLLIVSPSFAAEATPWNGKRAAVALTYDDALNVHLDKVAPELAKYDVKATFYVTVGFEGFTIRMDEWRQLAAAGHELGNHTAFHPCEGGRPGREWVEPTRDLTQWSLQRMVDDIQVANITLQALDGKTERTFAYPCGDMKAGGESYLDFVEQTFVGARGVKSALVTPQSIKLHDVDAFVVNGQAGTWFKQVVDLAIERGALVVFLFHGVGGEHALNVSAKEHAKLLSYLNEKRDQVWVAPMVDIVKFAKQP